MINFILEYIFISIIFYFILHFSLFCVYHIQKDNIPATLHFFKFAIISYVGFWLCQINKNPKFKKQLKTKIKSYLPDFIDYF